MRIEQQVVSLELAKRLKELGVQQESLFYWVMTGEEREPFLASTEDFDVIDRATSVLYVGRDDSETWENQVCYSAFTVAELGELLPASWTTYKTAHGEWRGLGFNIEYLHWHTTFHGNYGKSEADTRAEILIEELEREKRKEEA
jgi:hypothetical protein